MELVFHTTSGALWSGPPSTYLNVVVSKDLNQAHCPKLEARDSEVWGYISGWWFPNMCLLGVLFPIYGKLKNVPKHQPEKKIIPITMVYGLWYL